VNCICCGKFLPRTDALPVGGGVAHFACVARMQTTGARRGRVLVMVRRRARGGSC
jgi:hypothetical protein